MIPQELCEKCNFLKTAQFLMKKFDYGLILKTDSMIVTVVSHYTITKTIRHLINDLTKN